MKKILIFCFTFLSTTLLFACEKNEINPDIPVTLEVPVNEVTFWAEGGERVFELTSNTGIQVTSGASWCKAELMPGQNNRIRLTAGKNNEIGVDRSTDVTLQAGEITKKIKVVQFSEEPRAEVLEKGAYFNDNQTTEFFLTVSSNLDYTFETPSWVEEGEVKNVDALTKKHHFNAHRLTRANSKRDDEILVKFHGQAKVDDIVISIGQSNKKNEFSSASYNILVGTWQERKEMVYTIIDTYDFDIWGTQEGTLVHLTDITRKYDKYNFIGVGRDGENKGEYSAILYKTDRFEVVDEGNFWFSNTPERPSYGWDATGYRRICTWGKFRDKETNNYFYFFNSHFDHQGAVARYESAKLLQSKIESIVESGYPVFASGDYNCTPDSEPIMYLKSKGLLFDSRDLSSDPRGPLGSFNGLNPNVVSQNRIDFIFVSKEIDVKQYRVIDDRVGGKCPSDHDPVYIVIEF